MATKPFRVLLAATCKDLSTLSYPVLVSPKLDGIRALVIDGMLVSRTLKPIPNKELQARYGKPEFNGLDGELILGDPTAPDVFNKTTSCVMTRDADASEVKFYVFDVVSQNPYADRLAYVKTLCEHQPNVICVPQALCHNVKEAEVIEAKYVAQGFEGVVFRTPNGHYKQGRSTLKEQILIKYKRFETSEAIIIGFEEKMHNDNEATTDERGYTKRSSHLENRRAAGTLGALICKDLASGVEFNIGTGFSNEQRQHIWDNQEQYLNKIISYQHFPVGVVDKPRFPSYRGIRNTIDLGE